MIRETGFSFRLGGNEVRIIQNFTERIKKVEKFSRDRKFQSKFIGDEALRKRLK